MRKNSVMSLDTHDNPKGDRIADPPYRVRFTPDRSEQITIPSGDILHVAHTSGPDRVTDCQSLPQAVAFAEKMSRREGYTFVEHQYEPGEWMVLPKDPGLRAWQ